jgi:hypothetical protein
MIQRIQSIWLLLAVITLVAMFFLPVLTKGAEYSIYTSGLHQKITGADSVGYYVAIAKTTIALNAGAVLLCLAAIFIFRNRSLQKNTIIAGILVIVALAVVCGFNGRQLPGGIDGASLTIGTFLPVIAMGFCLLALRGIRKDEQLLRSADRLR